MPITELLERNADQYGNDVALVEINPEIKERRRMTRSRFFLFRIISGGSRIIIFYKEAPLL